MMNTPQQTLAAIAVVVADYDEAIQYYTGVLGFDLIEDTDMGGDKRWVLVAPKNSSGCQLLLAKAKNAEERSAIGNQTGGRVFFFLHTNDFWRDYNAYKAAGVEMTEAPREEVYGTVVVFKDIYGNKWDLIERKAS